MKQRRRPCPPSSSHHLAQMVVDLGLPRNAKINNKKLMTGPTLARVANLAGTAGAARAIEQLSTAPFVVVGWPKPCKAAQRHMRRVKVAAR